MHVRTISLKYMASNINSLYDEGIKEKYKYVKI